MSIAEKPKSHEIPLVHKAPDSDMERGTYRGGHHMEFSNWA